ncbi:terminase small subunit, partial [Megamonas funiformis]|uniref:terminase small subunit n=1 Tax=Megamonas funiformis TaxID=437897 RepID=UPI003FF14FD1
IIRWRGNVSNENIRELAYKDYLNGMKYKEIADKHNIKLSTIKSWATRYWKKLQSQPKEKVATMNTKKLQPRNEDTSHKIVKELKDVVMSDDSLTAEQQKFCIYYVMSNNALQSYLKAYRCSYECASASAYRLLGKVRIKEKINELKEIMREHIQLDVNDMVIFLSKVVKSDIRDYLKFGRRTIELSEGNTITVNFVDLLDSDTVDTSLIQEVKQGKDGVSLKLVDKRWAWEKLEKLLGWTTQEKATEEVVIIDNIPEVSDDE